MVNLSDHEEDGHLNHIRSFLQQIKYIKNAFFLLPSKVPHNLMTHIMVFGTNQNNENKEIFSDAFIINSLTLCSPLNMVIEGFWCNYSVEKLLKLHF